MKEAFETMGSHPLLTIFLGFVLVVIVNEICKALKHRK